MKIVVHDSFGEAPAGKCSRAEIRHNPRIKLGSVTSMKFEGSCFCSKAA